MQDKIEINPQASLPLLGFGTYMIPGAQTAETVARAISMGYRHIDTAATYGNEAEVGDGIADGLRVTGLGRDALFVTTKLWPGNTAWGQVPKTGPATYDAFHESLGKLKLDYVDLYLIHAPFDRQQMLMQWEALVELKAAGLVRSIGVSNFGISHLEAIAAAGLPRPEVNQIELHPWSQLPELVRYLRAAEIAVIAYSSLAPLSSWRSDPGQGSAKTEAMWAQDGETSPFRAMAAKYGVSEAQLLLRWAVQNGYAVLPKSTSEHRMAENANIFSFEIDPSDMALLRDQDRGNGFAWESGDPMEAAF